MILSSIEEQPKSNIAIQTSSKRISYQEMLEQVSIVVDWLMANNCKVLLLESDNRPEWIYIDLACQKAGVVFVPVPKFFSESQVGHVIDKIQPDIVITESNSVNKEGFIFPGFDVTKYSNLAPTNTPIGTSKITFTSGSTGDPKGVCLSVENQFKVAQALVTKIAVTKPIHFCLLSFSTLLENVAGVYSPLMAGGSVYVLTNAERGFDGANVRSLGLMLETMSESSADTIILVPELLQCLLGAIQQGAVLHNQFKFIAIGGSKVSPALIEQARALNLPVYQGYGLSECASVVSLSSAENNNINSVGEVLPHLSVDIMQGQVVIQGNVFLGYLNEPHTWYSETVLTGDIGQMDGNNLEVLGRESNLIINSFGRNISPEWVESELLGTGIFSQVVVFGDAKPFCVALISPIYPALSEAKIAQEIARVNSNLPEYAQVKRYIRLIRPLTFESGFLTSNGRPRRSLIHQRYLNQIETLFSEHSNKEYDYEAI